MSVQVSCRWVCEWVKKIWNDKPRFLFTSMKLEISLHCNQNQFWTALFSNGFFIEAETFLYANNPSHIMGRMCNGFHEFKTLKNVLNIENIIRKYEFEFDSQCSTIEMIVRGFKSLAHKNAIQVNSKPNAFFHPFHTNATREKRAIIIVGLYVLLFCMQSRYSIGLGKQFSSHWLLQAHRSMYSVFRCKMNYIIKSSICSPHSHQSNTFPTLKYVTHCMEFLVNYFLFTPNITISSFERIWKLKDVTHLTAYHRVNR